MPRLARTLLAAAALAIATQGAAAQTVTLKVHHFLPATSYAHTMFIKPWCDRIEADSNQRLKCQLYPSMQLGGTPPQLYNQVRDGVVDVIWTLPGYTAGRFPKIEAFELPFMMRSPEATSRALWDYVQQHAADEFKDVHPIAFHVHGPGVFHTSKKQIRTMGDLRGMKLRAPTRQTTRFLGQLGATPIGMPVPQVGEAISKGVIDGAVVPYEVVPAVRLQELAKFHSETDPSEPAFYTSTFVFAMNKARYDSLPADLRQVVDKHSGRDFSGEIGRVFAAADAEGKKLTGGNTTYVIPKTELENWKKAGQAVEADWIKEVSSKGADGKALLEGARALIARHSQQGK